MSEPDLQRILVEARAYQRDRPVLGAVHLVLPFAILATTLILLFLAGRLQNYVGTGIVFFFTVGKLGILSGAVADNPTGLTSLQLAAMVFYMDVLYAYFLAVNLHYIYRIPRVGPWLERVQTYCRYWIVTQPWMKRWAFTGVMLFVMFPLTGTGAPGGSILGRLVGLRASTTLTAIAVGSALGCGLMAAFAAPLEPIFHDLRHEWWFPASGVGVLAILLWFLFRLGRRLSKAAEDFARKPTAGGEL